MADADVRVEWLEALASGPGSFKPLTARNVRVSVALTDAGAPVLVLGLKPKEVRSALRADAAALARAEAVRFRAAGVAVGQAAGFFWPGRIWQAHAPPGA